MRRPLLAGLLFASGVFAFTGCVGASTSHESRASSTPPAPSRSAELDTPPVARAATSDLGVAVYDLGGYVSTRDSGFLLPLSESDRFPSGTYVSVVLVELDGFVPFGELDLAGLSVDETSWAGLGDLAELDQTEGPGFADDANIPWGPTRALGPDGDRSLANDQQASFALAYYVPFGVSTLDLVVDVPSQSVPLTLSIPMHGE